MNIHKKIEVAEARQKTLAEHLKNVERQPGVIIPEDVVKAARPEGSPLHKHFEWDNDKAAEEHRLWQARQLIARVYVSTNDEKDKSAKVRYYHSISNGKNEQERQYVSIVKAMSDEQMRDQLLRNAKKEMQSYVDKYGQLQELGNILPDLIAFSQS